MDVELVLFDEKKRFCDVLCQIAERLSQSYFEPASGLSLEKLTVSDVLQDVLDYSREFLEAEKCALFLVDMNETILVLERVSGSVDLKKLKDIATYDLRTVSTKGSGVTPWVFYRKAPFNARNFDELVYNSEGHWKGNWDAPMYGGSDQARNKFQCVYMVPLLAGQKAIGVLKYENRIGDNKYFDKSDERIIDIIAALVTNIVISQRIERNRYDAFLPTISSTLVSHLDHPNFYEELLEQCRKILRADLCSLFLVTDHESLDLKCIVGIDEEKKLKLVDFGYSNYHTSKGITPWILNRKASFNVRSYPDLQGRSEGRHVGKWDEIVYDARPEQLFKSLYSIPLVIGEEDIGVFKVENKNVPPYYFTESDERLFDLIGRLIAVGVRYEKAREFEKYSLEEGRIAEIGFLSAGISHEFNNYLNEILAFCVDATDMAEENKEINHEVIEGLNAIRTTVEHASQTIGYMKKLASRQADRYEFIDEIIEPILGITKARFLHHGINLDYELLCTGPVKLISGDVHIIIVNLLNNAFAAADRSTGNKLVKLFIYDSSDATVTIEVSDSGPGISREEKDKIFSAGYASSSSRGMGMGLFLVRRSVSNMGGTIKVISPNEHGGATFRIRLPRVISKETRDDR